MNSCEDCKHRDRSYDDPPCSDCVEDSVFSRALTSLEIELGEALDKAVHHLDYCGYGDGWERECADSGGLPDMLDKALAHYREAKGEK